MMRKPVRGVMAVMAAAPMLFLATPTATAASGTPAAVSAAEVDMKGLPPCTQMSWCFGEEDRGLFNMAPGNSMPTLGHFDNKIDTVQNRGRIAFCLYDGKYYRGRMLKKVKPGVGGLLYVRDRNKTSSIRAC